MMRGIAIRPVVRTDYEAIERLYARSVKSNPDGFIQDLSYHGRLTSKVRPWREDGGEFFVANLNGSLAGFGALARRSTVMGELCKLHVGEEFQGRGIGRLLSMALISHARMRGFAEVSLHVTATQSPAVALYRRLGFQETGRELVTIDVFGKSATFDTIYMIYPLKPQYMPVLESLTSQSA
jgi:ribosomal protein S18 acetylase RimI-like enzyme